MTTARPTRTTLRCAAALVAVIAGLVACGSDPPVEAAAPPDLQSALTLDVKGFQPAAAPEPPDTVCAGYPEESGPALDPALGDATSAGYRADGADLHAWAWRTDSPEAATAVVDEAVADIDGCRYQVYYDSDTDGDGEIDGGGSEQQSASPWSDENWTGMRIEGSSYGNGAELIESRFARSGDVVVLVVLTIHSNDDGLRRTLISYLDGVAARLG